MNMNTFKSNNYIGNFATNGKGIVTLSGSVRSFMSGEVYQGNGEMCKEVFALYGTYLGNTVLAPSATEMTFDGALTTPPGSPALMAGLMSVARISQFSTLNMTFDTNYMLENGYTNDRA